MTRLSNLNQIIYAYTVEVRNRFKGLDLIDRVPKTLWMEVRDIVQETEIEIIPMEKKCKKAKWLSGEALHIAVNRREAKSKGEKERYTHLNAELTGQPKRGGSWWRGLTECGPLEKGMANRFSIPALRTP